MCTKSNSGASAGRFTLPNEAAFTLTGTPGAGFDGTGIEVSVLYGAEVDGFTLSSLTVQNDNTTEGAVELDPGPGGVTIRSVTFANNHARSAAFYGGGALRLENRGCAAPGTTEAPITIAGSTFSDNSSSEASSGAKGGGATVSVGRFKCSPIRPVTLTNNSFSGNTVAGSAPNARVVGGGIAVVAQGEVIEPLTQSGNSFTGNAAKGVEGASEGKFGGGGEWIQGMDLTSTGDSFIGNTAVGSSTPAEGWTWGAGLGIINSNCTESAHTQGVATDLVVAGNSIVGGLAANAQGAGIYTGCDPGSGSDLTLNDSTVAGNSTAAGGVAGIYGEAVDRLTLTNTIDTGNVGGSDLGGFNGAGGSLTASYSDACLSGAALPGSGNICAPPLLASASDVHETTSSPTIDKGSNALVSAGLTSDFFGSARILPGRVSCSSPFSPATVDIGAAEFVTAIPACAPGVITHPTPNSSFSAVGIPHVNAITGAVTFTETVTDPGTFSWLLTFPNGKFGAFAARKAKKCAPAHIRLKGKCRPSRVVYAKGSKTVAAPGMVTFRSTRARPRARR
jgi:hypothetical protein